MPIERKSMTTPQSTIDKLQRDLKTYRKYVNHVALKIKKYDVITKQAVPIIKREIADGKVGPNTLKAYLNSRRYGRRTMADALRHWQNKARATSNALNATRR